MESGSPGIAHAQEIETSTSITPEGNSATGESPLGVGGEGATYVGSQTGDWTSMVQGIRFTSNGRYICGYVDSGQDLMQVLENYRTMTGTGFSNAQSLNSALKLTDDAIWQQRFISPSARPRLFWQMNSGEPNILYDGVPFMSVGQSTELPCINYGGRRKRTQQIALATGDVIPIDYRMRTGCEAKITIRKILRYPCAEIVGDISHQGIAAARRIRKQVFENLVQRIIAGISKPVERYFFLLPTPLAHNSHTIPDVEPIASVIQLVSDEIVSQVNQGITTVDTIREHVKGVVDSTLGAEAALHVNDMSYYPTRYDVFRLIYWLYKTGQVMDQESAFKSKLSFPTQTTDSPSDAVVFPAITCGASSAASPSQAKFSPSPIATENITSVYSIIMGDSEDPTTTCAAASGSGGGGGGLELSSDGTQHQLATEKEVEVHSSGGTVTTGSAGMGVAVGVVGGGGGMVNDRGPSPPMTITVSASNVHAPVSAPTHVLHPMSIRTSPSSVSVPPPSSAPPPPPSSSSSSSSGMAAQMMAGMSVNPKTFVKPNSSSLSAAVVAASSSSITLSHSPFNTASSRKVHVPITQPTITATQMGDANTAFINNAAPTITSSISASSGCSSNSASFNNNNNSLVITGAQEEVRDILRIIDNQTHACRNLQALNTLRRQLTELCSQFSMHLAGVPTKSFEASAAMLAMDTSIGAVPAAKRIKN